jgi:hypothetical protein
VFLICAVGQGAAGGVAVCRGVGPGALEAVADAHAGGHGLVAVVADDEDGGAGGFGAVDDLGGAVAASYVQAVVARGGELTPGPGAGGRPTT